MKMHKVPSLVDLCIQVAVDNVRYLGDVGETDFHLLERILPHCTLDQLMHIENSTQGRDLSPATDELWKKFYMRQFGIESVNIVVEKMRQKRVAFKWKQLYEAKLKDREEATQKSLDRIKKRYQEEDARNLIGKGGFADVYRDVLSGGRLVDVKRLTRVPLGERMLDFLSELEIMGHLNHPNTAKMVGYGIEAGLFLIMELYPHGSLASMLQSFKEKLTWDIRYKIALGAAEGVSLSS